MFLRSCHYVFPAKRKTKQSLAGDARQRLRVKDKLRKACKRTAKTSEQALHRQRQNKENMASVRAAESSEQTLRRQQHDREYRASVRAAESSDQTLGRQQHDRDMMYARSSFLPRFYLCLIQRSIHSLPMAKQSRI